MLKQAKPKLSGHLISDTPSTNTHIHDSLWVADIRDRAVEWDPVADKNVEAVLPVGLVNTVRVRQGERLPLFTVT